MRRLALLVLFLAVPAWANSVTLPVEVKVKAGRLAKLTATTDGTQVRWINGSLDADLIASESGFWAIFSAPAPGRYLVYAYTAKGDVPSEPAMCVVIVGEPGPVPPVPVPPGPVPPPPPYDPFQGNLQAAWALENEAGKYVAKGSLATIYRQGASVVKSDTTLQTWGALFDALNTVAKALNISGKLPQVQKVIQTELLKSFPTDRNAALDPAGRDTASRVFSRVADALEAVK